MARASLCTPSRTVALARGLTGKPGHMGLDPRVVAELATIVALSATTVGAIQIRHTEGQVALSVGVTRLVGVLICRVALARKLRQP